MRRARCAVLGLALLALAAPGAHAADPAPWRRCGALTVERVAIASYATQRLGCAHGLELVLRARRLSGGEEGSLRIDRFRCRVRPVEGGTWYWCGDGRRAVRARLTVF
jgi:hypothetical protein